jgi:sugar-specific transcriptional regulator TrmB
MSMQNEVEKLSHELQETLDLDELESKIYLSLLRTGPITASALAKDLNVDRATVYRTVEKLVDMSFISTSFTNPKLCASVEPETAFKMVLDKKEEKLRKIKKIEKTIIEDISSIRYCPSKGPKTPTLRIVQGRANIYSDIAQMIENCFETIFIVTTMEDISKMYHSMIPEKIKICKKKGGKVMLLVEIDDIEMISFVKRLNPTETRICKLPSKGRIAVQKDKQMIMSDSSQIHSNFDTDLSLSTNAKDMTNNIDSLCRFLWKSAKPLEIT